MTEPTPDAGPRRHFWRDPLAIVTVLLWVGFLLTIRSMHHEHTLVRVAIAAGDLLAQPGEEIELLARVERRSADGTVERSGIAVDLRFSREPDGVGTVETDTTGHARRRTAAPAEPGVHRFVILPEGPHVADPPLRFDPRVFVIDPERPLAILDLEGTLAPEGSPFPDEVPPNAIVALHAIAAEHTLVFLSTAAPNRADVLRGELLRHQELPRAAVVAARNRDESAESYLLRQVEDWSRRLGTPARAIAGSETACRTFRATGIPTLILGTPPCDGAVAAADWDAVRTDFTRPDETREQP